MGLEEAFDYILWPSFERTTARDGDFPKVLRALRQFEMWRYEGVEELKIVDDELKPEDVEKWCDTRGEDETEARTVAAGLKLIICEVPMGANVRQPAPEEVDTSAAAVKAVDSLGLVTGWNWETRGIHIMPHECDKQPTSTDPALHFRYSLYNTQLRWRFERAKRTVVGTIIVTNSATPGKSQEAQELVKILQNSAQLLGLPLFPVLAPIIEGLSIAVETKSNRIQREQLLEDTTGFTFLNSNDFGEDEGYAHGNRNKYGNLSVEAAALAASFSNLKATLAALEQSVRKIKDQNEIWRKHLQGGSTDSDAIVRQHNILDQWITYVHAIITAHNGDLDNWLFRANNQLSVLYNLITQRDQRINLQLARDSRELAIESKRDSASMKTLAAVTTVFLPGTFIASLFAIPVFDWRADPAQHEEVLHKRFWVYWAVTIPVTIVTMVVWYVWFKYSTSRHKLEVSNIMSEFDQDDLTGEVSRPVRKPTRKSTFLSEHSRVADADGALTPTPSNGSRVSIGSAVGDAQPPEKSVKVDVLPTPLPLRQRQGTRIED